MKENMDIQNCTEKKEELNMHWLKKKNGEINVSCFIISN